MHTQMHYRGHPVIPYLLRSFVCLAMIIGSLFAGSIKLWDRAACDSGDCPIVVDCSMLFTDLTATTESKGV